MKSNFRSVRFVILGLFFAVSVRAASAAPPAATFRLIAINCSVSDVFYEPAPGKEPVPLTVRKSPTKDYPRPTTPLLEIFRFIPPPSDAPPGTKPTKQTVVTAKLAANDSSSLIVLIPADKDTFAAVVVADDATTHPAGTLRVINLGKRRVGVALDDTAVELDSKASKLLPIASGKKVFKLRFAHQGDGLWDGFWDQSLLFTPEVRSFAFIYDAPGVAEPQVKLRSERPPGFWKPSLPPSAPTASR